MKNKKILKKVILGIGVFTLLLTAVSACAYHLAFWNKIYPGVKIAGVSVGNKTIAEADSLLTKKINSLPEKIILSSPNKTWEINLKEISFSYQKQKALKKAYQVGRNKNPFKAWQEKKTAWVKGVNIPLEYKLNQEAFQNQLDQIATSVFIPTVNPQIKISSSQNQKIIIIEPGQSGQELDKRLFLAIFSSNISQLNFQPLKLPLNKTNPALSEEETNTLKIRAEKFLGKTLKIEFEDFCSVVDDKQLINLISPFGGFDKEKIKSLVENLSLSINRPAQNASFKFEQGRVVLFQEAVEGIRVKEKETEEKIIQELIFLETQEQKEQTLTPEVIRIEPEIKTEDANNLGIEELLGRGESYFKGSIPSRVHNIILASKRLNGLLIKPGEVFSFNQALGEVSSTTGYQEAYIIREGRTVLGDGGGVCQVSTTLFRAALNAGLPIIERKAHAYRVGYYEQHFSPGFDATVFSPSVDLKFKNNTPAYILIQSQVNQKTSHLSFSLYGKDDGRKITITKPRVWDQTPPPPPLYQDDPTLPSGVVKQIDWASWGAKVSFDYKVERDGEILEKQTFYSVYQPWQAVYLRGSKS